MHHLYPRGVRAAGRLAPPGGLWSGVGRLVGLTIGSILCGRRPAGRSGAAAGSWKSLAGSYLGPLRVWTLEKDSLSWVLM